MPQFILHGTSAKLLLNLRNVLQSRHCCLVNTQCTADIVCAKGHSLNNYCMRPVLLSLIWFTERKFAFVVAFFMVLHTFPNLFLCACLPQAVDCNLSM